MPLPRSSSSPGPSSQSYSSSSRLGPSAFFQHHTGSSTPIPSSPDQATSTHGHSHPGDIFQSPESLASSPSSPRRKTVPTPLATPASNEKGSGSKKRPNPLHLPKVRAVGLDEELAEQKLWHGEYGPLTAQSVGLDDGESRVAPFEADRL
jgi:hypothetical protein